VEVGHRLPFDDGVVGELVIADLEPSQLNGDAFGAEMVDDPARALVDIDDDAADWGRHARCTVWKDR
jgi:hypothetical protein